MIPKSDADWQRVLHAAAVGVAEARADGDQDQEIFYRKELQRLSNLHAQWKTGKAISETEFTLRDFGANLPGAFGETFGSLGALVKLAPPLIGLYLLVQLSQGVRR